MLREVLALKAIEQVIVIKIDGGIICNCPDLT